MSCYDLYNFCVNIFDIYECLKILLVSLYIRLSRLVYRGLKNPVFFAASRGHHADIGGITPGSMPPHSKSLKEEGATFKTFFLVRKGHFCEEELTEALMAPGKIPGSSGTRNLKDNISDLKAQIAANQKVIIILPF